jgi:hypothetical protein
MSIPATIDVLTAVRARVAAQCAPVAAVPISLTVPLTPDQIADTLGYVLHLEPPGDAPKTAGGSFLRTHRIEIGLWARTPDDDAETRLLALSDAVSGAFFQYQTLGGIANSASLSVPPFPPYIRIGGQSYRQRIWELRVVQTFAVTMQ